MNRDELLEMIRAFIESRPGFDLANYGSIAGYRADQRRATQQLRDARAMLAVIESIHSITAEKITAELRSGGRLKLTESGKLHYCAGQYYPTEFRAGVCRVLSSLLWDYWRECAPSTPEREAVRKFGRGIALRWFR